MTVPNTRNARIAIAKGWRVERERGLDLRGQPIIWQGQEIYKERWYDSEDKYRGFRPYDWVGTLAGVAELMKDLENALDEYGVPQRWFSWGYNIYTHQYVCLEGVVEIASSPDDRPGDCVGDAWLSEFGKERTRG